MNKKELINMMSNKTNMDKKDVEKVLKSFIETIEEALVIGDKVQLVGFGTFEVRERKARQGRNPRNPKEIIEIPAYKIPVFKAGKNLKEYVNI